MDERSAENGDQQFTEDPQNSDFNVDGGSEACTVSSNSAVNSEGDNDDRKIFVGGLSWETTVKDLREYFSKFGEVSDCTLKTDQQTGRSRGFGFVLFDEAATVDKVIAEGSHLLHERTIDPKRANPRGNKELTKKVFVGGLDPQTPEDEIRKHFGVYGKIEEIDLPYDKIRGQRRAFCFITFESELFVNKCCKASKQSINGKEVDVKKATPKGSEWGFGGYGGRAGRGSYRGRGGRGGYGGYNYGYYQGYDYNYYQPSSYDYGGYGNYGQYDYNYYGPGYYNQGYGDSGYGNNGCGGYGGKRRSYGKPLRNGSSRTNDE